MATKKKVKAKAKPASAGDLRTVKIAKGESMFALPQHVAPYLTGVLGSSWVRIVFAAWTLTATYRPRARAIKATTTS